MSDTDALLATVRQVAGGLAEQQAMPDDWWQEKLDTALDSLAAELERRDKRIMELIEGHALQEYAAELERVKAERDELITIIGHAALWKNVNDRLDKALSALREIAVDRDFTDGDLTNVAHVARAAIAEIEGEA